MATVAEVRNQAAERLGLYGTGQTLPAREAADLLQAYAEIHAALTVKDQAPWDYSGSVDDTVPDEYVPHVAALMARARVVQYKPPPERLAMIMADAQEAVPEIRELNRGDHTGVVWTEYY